MAYQALRWGLLSTARINRAVIPPIQSSPPHELIAVGSRGEAQAREYARKWGIPKAHGSYEALLADPEIDVVYNPLPNSMHAEWTIRAVEAGKHVLCEKPLALTPAEVDLVEAAAKKTGKVVAEAFMYRHHPQTRKVKEIVDSGALGRLRLVRGCFSYYLKREDDIRLDPHLGGGCIWDVGCYPISYARYLIGSGPVEVYGWQLTGPSGVDLTFTGQMRYSGEVFAQFDCSFRQASRTWVEVVGSDASLFVSVPFKPEEKETLYLQREGKMEQILVKGEPLYVGEIEDMWRAVTEGRPPEISLAESRDNVRTIHALLESARSGKPVLLGD